MRRAWMTTLALTAAIGVVGAGTAHADTKARPALRAVLQTDADRLLDYGAPGVLVELDTQRGDVQVRSGYGNVAKRSPVPWNAKFRIARGFHGGLAVESRLRQLWPTLDDRRMSFFFNQLPSRFWRRILRWVPTPVNRLISGRH